MKNSSSKPTITDVADLTGLSIATVSRAVNHPELVSPKTAARIREAMEQLQYSPKNASTPVISETLLINIDTSLNHFYARVIEGLKASSKLHGYKLLIDMDICGSEEDLHLLAQRIRLNNIRGIVFINSNNTSYFDRILDYVPLVQCLEVNSDKHTYVSIDEHRAVFSVMDHLMHQGARDIILLNGPVTPGFSQQRQQAFIEYMAMKGVPESECRIINLPSHNYDMAFSTFTRLLSGQEKPDAVFATSDLLASAVINAAKTNSISVPGQMLVAGFNNDAYSTISTPRITTVSQPLFNMGFTAGEVLYDYIAGRSPRQARFVRMDTELIIRESSMLPVTS